MIGAILASGAIIGLVWIILRRRKAKEQPNPHESQPFVPEKMELDAQDTQRKFVSDAVELPPESQIIHEMDVPSDAIEFGTIISPKATKPEEVHELGPP